MTGHVHRKGMHVLLCVFKGGEKAHRQRYFVFPQLAAGTLTII